MIKLSKEIQKEYVSNLDLYLQRAIRREAKKEFELLGFEGRMIKNELELVTNSMVCDLDNVIKIKYV